MSETVEIVLDVKGLQCPMPLLKAKRALNGMKPDELLRVYATDPGSMKDFRVFCEQSGNSLLKAEECDGSFTYLLKKKSI